jgi:hypothetical protein
MSNRFRREGLGFRFAPAEAPAVFVFSRPRDNRDEITFEVAVARPDGRPVMTRRINLLASPTRGNTKDLLDELRRKVNGPDWDALILEACESVLASHRAGRPTEVISGEMQRPPPPPWLCEGLLLKNKPNCWFGAASTGKSTLAKAICAYYAAGFRFCGRPMERGVPLYLDWEDDRDGFLRTVYDVCRNLGVWPLPRMLWRDMHGHKLRDQIEILAEVADLENVGLIVLDAIAAAGGSPGEHMSWEAVALELEQCLGQLPPVTVLGLDHVTSAEHKDAASVPLKARGAERKVEFFRNQWTLVGDREASDDGRHLVSWTHAKINAAAKEKPFLTEIIHRDAEISIVVRDLEASEEAMQRLTEMQRILRYLAVTPAQTAQEICEAVYGTRTETRVSAVRVQLSRAKARNLVWKDAADRWYGRNNVAQDGQVIPFPGGAS